jgi:hypothetical protein
MPEEESTLRRLLRNLMVYFHDAITSDTPRDFGTTHAVLSPPETPEFLLSREPLPAAPPRGIKEVRGWKVQARRDPQVMMHPSYDWIRTNGVRGGWAHIDRDLDELERLARGLKTAGMNFLWGVGFPQLLTNPEGKPEAKTKLVACWEKLDEELAGSGIKWLVGLEYPGRYASKKRMSKAVGARGQSWDAPSPWDLSLWRREVVEPARLVAQRSRKLGSMAGIVVDPEMYGRRPLYFSQGVEFGDESFRGFLDSREKESSAGVLKLPHGSKFSWLRDQGLLGDYYGFLESRAEQMGRELRETVREVNPNLILGCYSAGVLHRWFYRGLWRGMSEQDRPILLFTFQRDAELDLRELESSGIHVLHVRALLMGVMEREDYGPLFRDSLEQHWGYWLNRLTSLVATDGFYQVEAPKGMTQEEAWRLIKETNEKTGFRSKGQ